MEFVRIGRMKETLIAGPLSALETAKYLAFQGAFLSLLFIPSPADFSPDWTLAAYPLSAVAGVYYCYKRNGGSAGVRFAERYLALSWVVGIRVALSVVVPAVVGVFLYAFAADDLEWLDDERLGDALNVFGLGLVVLIYWRTGVHLAAIHSLGSRQV